MGETDYNALLYDKMKAEQDKEENNYAYTSDILKNISMGGKTGMKNGLKNA